MGGIRKPAGADGCEEWREGWRDGLPLRVVHSHRSASGLLVSSTHHGLEPRVAGPSVTRAAPPS
jgi:hypothetical protein